MTTIDAAWISAKHARLVVGQASYTAPRESEIVVENRAVAINPLDWIIQADGSITYGWLTYPTVLGADVAGEVVDVGPGVTRFRVGDRVLGLAVGTDKDRNTAAEGAFQTHTVLLAHLAAPIPDGLSYDDAAVLPLGLATAACGLFQKDQLALHHPSAAPTPTGQTLLVWGGSSSVGSNAIQLAVAAGYDVVATASPRNFDYVRTLGASDVFDYNSPAVIDDLTHALAGRTLAGALAVGTGSAAPCAQVVGACKGNRFVSMTSPSVSFDILADGGGTRRQRARVLWKVVSSTASLQIRSRLRGTRVKFVFATTVKDNEVGGLIFEEFLPAALAEGRYLAAPQAHVIGTGLGHIQDALDLVRHGVSAQKIVVAL